MLLTGCAYMLLLDTMLEVGNLEISPGEYFKTYIRNLSKKTPFEVLRNGVKNNARYVKHNFECPVFF